MNAFEKNLLNKLLDKYESSKLSKGGTVVSRSIKLTTRDDVLSSYVGNDAYKYADENDAIIKKLVELGFIRAEWNFDSFKSLTLVIENVGLIYDYLNRAKPADELERIRTVLSKYRFDNFLEDFIEYVNNYINKRYDHINYFETYVMNQDYENFLKSHSTVLKGNDKKYIENIIQKYSVSTYWQKGKKWKIRYIKYIS
mgnify:CR=1 FL=1